MAAKLRQNWQDLAAPLQVLGDFSPRFKTTWIAEARGAEGAYPLPCIQFSGPEASHDPIRIGLFAGLHGDEPAGILGLLQFLENLAEDPRPATGYELWVYPVCNPTGYAQGQRNNAAGLDLNREFWRGSEQPEVIALERELRTRRFNGIITLHSDDTAEGIYGYTHGSLLNEALLEPALEEASGILPRDERAQIDGFSARRSKICTCYQGVLSAPAAQSPQPFDLIFETPALAPIHRQVAASVSVLDTVLREYRKFLAHAMNL